MGRAHGRLVRHANERRSREVYAAAGMHIPMPDRRDGPIISRRLLCSTTKPMSRKTIAIASLFLLVPLLIVAQQSQERVDLNVMHKIKTAEFGGGGGFGGG